MCTSEAGRLCACRGLYRAEGTADAQRRSGDLGIGASPELQRLNWAQIFKSQATPWKEWDLNHWNILWRGINTRQWHRSLETRRASLNLKKMFSMRSSKKFQTTICNFRPLGRKCYVSLAFLPFSWSSSHPEICHSYWWAGCLDTTSSLRLRYRTDFKKQMANTGSE